MAHLRMKKEEAVLARKAAEAVVDAAMLCQRELASSEAVAHSISLGGRAALVEAVQKNPLLTAKLFLREQ